MASTHYINEPSTFLIDPEYHLRHALGVNVLGFTGPKYPHKVLHAFAYLGEEIEGEDGDKADGALDLSKMTPEERERLKQEVSSTRIFSASDFVKMRKLVQREERLRRDPREAARRKRAIARGQEFEELSDDSSVDSDEEEAIHVKGAVNPYDIMAAAKRKRQSKAEKLEKILAGREKFEAKERAGGSTNTEKERRKNFLMSKSSRGARSKGRGKGGLSAKRGNGQAQMGHEAKKRRRKV